MDWLSLYMGWAIHILRLIPRFTNTLLVCCGREYEVRSLSTQGSGGFRAIRVQHAAVVGAVWESQHTSLLGL